MTSAPAPSSASTGPAFSSDDVRAVIGDVWEACLASSGEPLLEGTADPLDGDVVAARIRIAGDWDGTVSLEMSGGTATTAARLMLDADEVRPDEVADAVGELVNIIGGNIKSLLPTPSKLSLPQVAHAGSREAEGQVVEHCRVDLSWGTRAIQVRIWS